MANAPLIAFAAVTLLEALLVASLLIYFFVVRGNSLRTWTFDKAVANKLIRDGAPLALSTLAGFIYVHFDKLMLGSTVGMSSVGVYAVYSSDDPNSAQMLFASINASATPAIMKSYAENRTDCLNRISRVITLNAWLALWAAVLLTLFGNQLIHLVFGGELTSASRVLLVVLALGLVVQAPSGLRTEYLLLAEATSHLVAVRLISVFVNVGLNVVFIPMYGLEGAAIATFLTVLFFDGVSLFLFRSSRPYGSPYVRAIYGAFLQVPLLALVHALRAQARFSQR